MGIDLKVMASYFRERRGELLPTATLRLERDSELFGKLAQLARPLPQGLKAGCYEDEGLIFTDADRAGSPLTFITSADMMRLDLSGEQSRWNGAVLAFLLALPEDARIILYWC